MGIGDYIYWGVFGLMVAGILYMWYKEIRDPKQRSRDGK